MAMSHETTASKRLGTLPWLLCFQFLVAEYVVSLACPFPYSRFNNYISDLGSVHCAVLTSGFTAASHQVCSPLHVVMNASFVIEGVLIALGAVFMRRLLPAGRAIAIALVLFFITGIGFMMAGFAPNDVNLPVHYTGAVLGLFGASTGMLVVGGAMLAQRSAPTWLAVYTLASGIVASAGTIFISSGVTLGVGVGGIERVAFYPYPLWLMLTGFYYLSRHDREG